MDAWEEYRRWCTGDGFDEETKQELAALTDEKEIADRFYKELTFGTGGLRGMIGAGTNRMNRYTVGRATQGLADYINGQTKGGSVVIAYDSRRMSAEFALDSACILAANNIRAYLFDALRPTPELSFAVRFCHATAGIVITASHNPPAYNGYKVYWSDGGQIVPPHDKNIIACVEKIGYGDVRRIAKEEAIARGLLVMIGEETDRAYLDAVKALSLSPEAVRAQGKKLKIVYTPLHGTGNLPVRRILAEMGFENVFVVPEQALPDGNFPTVAYPNPEDKKAFALALALAEREGADLVLATDPDADRLGVYAKDKTGGYFCFTGNMSGILIAEYVLSRRKEKGLLPADGSGALVTTIVSTKLARPLAEEYGLTLIETLTGFKYIGEQIHMSELAAIANGGRRDARMGAYTYEFGFEESYGCLAGTYARDKDAVAAVMLLAEAAAYYAELGITLSEQMESIYRKYGYQREELYSETVQGMDGLKKIASAMQRMRKEPPKTLGGKKVLAVRDYLTSVRRAADGKEEALRLPKSDVLYFELEGGWCCVRPSGTEPKIKFYIGLGEREEEAFSAVRRDLLAVSAF